MTRVIRCDCGFEAVADDDADLVAQAQAHAKQTHDMEVTAEFLLSVALARGGRAVATASGPRAAGGPNWTCLSPPRRRRHLGPKYYRVSGKRRV